MAPSGIIAVGDLAAAVMWVWAGAFSKLLVHNALGLRHRPEGEVLMILLWILFMFFFAWFRTITNGATSNPLLVLSSAFSGGIGVFLFSAFGRIPAQVVGSVIGVSLITKTFPELGYGPRLKVEIHHGALTEGMLTFLVVIVSMGLQKKGPRSFFMKTWIASLSKVSVHFLGSNFTGGIMNPAAAFGWAYVRGDHTTLAHLFVYWVAPIQATILAVWTFRLFSETRKSKEA